MQMCSHSEDSGSVNTSQLYNAYLEKHDIAAVLEAGVGAVLSKSSNRPLAAALADEIEAAHFHRLGDACAVNIPAHLLSEMQARLDGAGLDALVGHAVSELLAEIPHQQPLLSLAKHLRTASARIQGAVSGVGGGDAAAATTQQWAQLVAHGWAQAAAISVGGGGGGGCDVGTRLDEDKLLVRVTKQNKALSKLESALSLLELHTCQRRMQSIWYSFVCVCVVSVRVRVCVCGGLFM